MSIDQPTLDRMLRDAAESVGPDLYLNVEKLKDHVRTLFTELEEVRRERERLGTIIDSMSMSLLSADLFIFAADGTLDHSPTPEQVAITAANKIEELRRLHAEAIGYAGQASIDRDRWREMARELGAAARHFMENPGVSDECKVCVESKTALAKLKEMGGRGRAFHE